MACERITLKCRVEKRDGAFRVICDARLLGVVREALSKAYPKLERDERGFRFPTYGHASDGVLIADDAILSQYDATLLLAC